ncbi:MAG TPA: YndJ family transporter, partial [Euzebya sp.]|nr:YndJ family transporter [Euzebya sp.]
MDVGLTRLLLVLGVVVVAPAVLRLHTALDGRLVSGAVVSGVLAGIGVILPAGLRTAALSLPWAVLAGVAVLSAVPRTVSALRGATDMWGIAPAVAPLAALAFWTVGSVWLLLDRLALDPVGVGPDLVLLTAVHFHFAGLAATTIVATSVSRGAGGMTALLGTLVAPVLVAVGFVAVPALQVLGAIVFTV